MMVHTAHSLGLVLAHRVALPLVLLVSVHCVNDSGSPAVGPGSTQSAQERRATSNPVIHWNSVASRFMTDPGPIIDSRAYTILHASIHDAVNGIERRYRPYTADLSFPGASLDAAVARAARDVIVKFSPSQREKVEAEYASVLAAIPDGPAKQEGVTLGRRAAEANLQRRSDDGVPIGPWPPMSGPITQPVYRPTGRPGDYAFTPPFDRPPLGPIALFPGWGRVQPFAVDVSKYRLPGPDALPSDAYARDVNHVKAIGSLNSPTRTADQTEIARFWFEDFPVFNQIANSVMSERQVDAWDAARTFALLHLAIADAGIACFQAKYRFRFWRPFTAIRRASEDDNAATIADTTWLPLLWTPLGNPQPTFLIPPIPEYPSAAATLSGAGAEILSSVFGDAQRFEATSPFVPGVIRRYTSFSQAADEAGMSRVYGGIHFLRAVKDGARLGRSIGRDVSRLLPSVRR
jgi:hypothetical protein